MASNFAPIVDRIRILPRRSEFLGRNIGVVGEVYYDNTTNTLRIYDGKQQGGFSLAKSDLSNVSNADFLSKASLAGAGGGGASVVVSNTAPESPSEGSIWFNSETSSLSVYVGTEWVAPIPTSIGTLTELQMSRGVAIAEFSTDAGLTDASSDTVPTESAVKGYVDTQIAALTGLPASVVIQDNAPTLPQSGDLWWESSTGRLKIYYDDGTSSQWVDATPPIGSNTVTTSLIAPFAFARINVENVSTPTSHTGISSAAHVYSAGVSSYIDFVFTTAQANTNYTIVTDMEIAGDANIAIDITNKTTTGFRANFFADSTGAELSTGSVGVNQPVFLVFGETPTVDVSAVAIQTGAAVSNGYEPAIAVLRVANDSTTAYTFNSHYSGNNPNLYAISGTTIAFDLSNISGHPFEIQNSIGNQFNTGLVHVAPDGSVSLGQAAQGKDTGTLYWRIPESISGVYGYQCQIHPGMAGSITIKRLSLI